MRTVGLSLDQAPQLSIPASFFLTIPIGVLLAGYILVTTGSAAFVSPWMPQALALTHAGTLGVLAMGMIGALYQMTPVVAGAPVPLTRIAHIVHILIIVGLAGLVLRLLGGSTTSMMVAIVCFSIALPAFLLPLGWALLRAPTKDETVQGMRVAILSLAVVTLIGIVLAGGFAGGAFSANRMVWMQVHMTLAVLGWVGGLIIAVSWQVIPMFYLASAVSKTMKRWLLFLLIAGLVLPLIVAFTGSEIDGLVSTGQLTAIAALPAALAAWLLHPALILHKLSQRQRRRSDASLLFWQAGLSIGLLLIPVAIAAVLSSDPRWQVLFGWLIIWGWAATIMHGMLSRIVPFLVWFHRYSARVGLEIVPSMRSLLPQQRIKIGFKLHLGSVLLGVLAIYLQVDWLAQLTGLLLAATALSIASMLIHILRSR
ncbi:MAG: hypothetical protein OEU84_15840 [Xanthomonadales bacterium]|nr:hypothetical protein [Xanthomonadales bacterium]